MDVLDAEYNEHMTTLNEDADWLVRTLRDVASKDG